MQFFFPVEWIFCLQTFELVSSVVNVEIRKQCWTYVRQWHNAVTSSLTFVYLCFLKSLMSSMVAGELRGLCVFCVNSKCTLRTSVSNKWRKHWIAFTHIIIYQGTDCSVNAMFIRIISSSSCVKWEIMPSAGVHSNAVTPRVLYVRAGGKQPACAHKLKHIKRISTTHLPSDELLVVGSRTVFMLWLLFSKSIIPCVRKRWAAIRHFVSQHSCQTSQRWIAVYCREWYFFFISNGLHSKR